MVKLFVFLLIILTIAFIISQKLIMKEPNNNLNTPNKMVLTSPDFNDQKIIPVKFTCQGENINPALNIENTPNNAQSLVLIVDDPDAPVGTFTHWVIWNINPSTTKIDENSVPSGAIQGLNSANQNHYTGPCPPSGTHRYFFRIYALDTNLNLPLDTTTQGLFTAIQDHIIDKTELIGKYQKS